ncbi:MAG: RNA polymerase sigma factor [Candidatus Paceibacterota bacterium]|jgi:RNA polymerase sigma-70 factor (ECF subfamily)
MTQKKEAQLNAVLTNAHREYGTGLNAYAFSKVHNQGMSDDLVQDTFIKTWRFLVKKGKVHMMKAFLYHVLNRLVIDEYRKRKIASLDVLTEKGFEPSIDDLEQHFDVLDGKILITLIDYLPEKYQKVMKMRYIKMFSLKEISLITGETKNTIAVQIHRGLKKLKFLYDNSLSSEVASK